MDNVVEQKVMELVSKYSDFPLDQLSSDVALSDTGIESIGVAELIFDLEDIFSISIEDTNDIQSRFDLGTIADLTGLVESLRTEQPA
ncbi:MAG: acyl carrier protein [Flavobacteriales bacterium]|jgi:acyl carrier protein